MSLVSVLAVTLVLIMFAAVLAGASEYSGVSGFIKKWAGWVVVVAGFIASGVLMGAIMRNAMCAGFWVCE